MLDQTRYSVHKYWLELLVHDAVLFKCFSRFTVEIWKSAFCNTLLEYMYHMQYNSNFSCTCTVHMYLTLRIKYTAYSMCTAYIVGSRIIGTLGQKTAAYNKQQIIFYILCSNIGERNILFSYTLMFHVFHQVINVFQKNNRCQMYWHP